MKKPFLTVAELTKIGRFEACRVTIGEDQVLEYARISGDMDALSDRRPRDESGEDRLKVPDGLCAVLLRWAYLGNHRMPAGGVILELSFDYLSPWLTGRQVDLTAELASIRRRDPKNPVVSIETSATALSGRLLQRGRLTALWPLSDRTDE